MKSNYKDVDLYTYNDPYTGKETFRGLGKKSTTYSSRLLDILQYGMWWGWRQKDTDHVLTRVEHTFQLPGEFLC